MADKRLSSYLPWLLLLIVCASFVVNFGGLSRFRAPPGADYGNYLAQVDILRGKDLRGEGLRHSPVFFVLLDMFLRIFEEFTALKVVASLIFSIIAIPFFLLARKFSGRSTLAPLVCTWLFVFFLGNFEMISWGGNPNMLGFSFMLLTLFFFVELMDEPSKKNLLLTAFSLSLVIGTHLLVAAYLLLSLFLFLIMAYLTREIRKVPIKSLLFMALASLVFSLPYFSFYFKFFRGSTDGMGAFNLLSIQIPPISFSSIWGLWEYWEFFVVAIIFSLSLIALSNYLKDGNKKRGLLLCSLLLLPLILILITEHRVRWLYFFSIPLFLCFGIYLKDLFSDVKNSEGPIRILVICFIAIIVFHTTVTSLLHFERSIEFYQFIEDDEIKALNWIKENTAPNATLATSGHPKGGIGGGGNSYAWWIEGYSNRVTVCSGDLKYYSYPSEREEVQKANRIFAGTYSAEYENLRVAEGGPSTATNPKIAAFVDKDYQDLLILNDYQHQLFFTSNENEQEYIGIGCDNRTSSIEYGDTWANFTFTCHQTFFDVTRSVIMGEEKSSVDVVFQVVPKNVTLLSFQVNLWALFETTWKNCDYSEDHNVVSLSPTPPNKGVQTHIRVLETNGNLWDAGVMFADPSGSRPEVYYSFEPLQDSLYVRLRIIVEPSTEDTDETQTLRFYDSHGLIKDLHVDYILLNRGRENEYDRFLADSENFSEVKEFQNNRIKIFEVTLKP